MTKAIADIFIFEPQNLTLNKTFAPALADYNWVLHAFSKKSRKIIRVFKSLNI